MKRIKYLISILVLFLTFNINVLAEEINIYSDKAVLINLNDDKIIYEKNKEEKTAIASLTKIMTAITVLDNVNLEDKITITNEDMKGLYEQDASLANFKLYEEYTYLEMLYGLLLPSGADCANSLARNVAGSIDNFVVMMNNKKDELKLTNTNFANPTGLDDINNYSTAEDMAKLMKYAIKNETLKKIITTMEYTTHDNIKLTNTIQKYSIRYDITLPVEGGKTGNTEEAFGCLTTIANKNNISYLLVLLNAKDHKELEDTKNIYDYYMTNYNYQTLIEKNDTIKTLETVYAKDKKININLDNDYKYYLNNNYDKNLIKTKYNGLEKISYKMKKNTKIGTLTIYYDNKELDKISLYLNKDMEFSILSYIKENIILILPTVLSILVLLILIIKGRNKMNKNETKFIKINRENIDIIDLVKTLYIKNNIKLETNKKIEELQKIIPNNKHYLLVISDGTGSNLINTLNDDKILKKNKIKDITTIFPSTTGCVLTSIVTATYPEEHGIWGWFNHSEEFKIDYQPLTFQDRKNRQSLHDFNIKNEDIFKTESLLKQINKKVNILFPKQIIDSEYSKFVGFDKDRYAYENYEDIVKFIQKNIKEQKESFTYLYIPDIDSLEHSNGVYDEKVLQKLNEINNLIETISKNKDLTIIFTSDHGQIDALDPVIMDFNKYEKYFKYYPSIDFGTASYYIKDEYKKEFEHEFKKDFKKKMYLYKTIDLFEKNFFGTNNPKKYAKDNLGEYISICEKGSYFINDPDYKKYYKTIKGNHSGLTKEEMTIPLIIINTNKNN